MSVFSVEDTTEAPQIEDWFVDIAAHLRSIEPPKFPGSIDSNLATHGEQVFAANGSQCHGTYGPDGDGAFTQAFHLDQVGWRDTPSDGQTFDASQPGASNKGHTHGDALSADDRRALLEYLKTL
jgi:mono/diheme cytochrome c family protein